MKGLLEAVNRPIDNTAVVTEKKSPDGSNSTDQDNEGSIIVFRVMASCRHVCGGCRHK